MISDGNFGKFDFYLKDINEVSNRCKIISKKIEVLQTSLRMVKWGELELIVEKEELKDK